MALVTFTVIVEITEDDMPSVYTLDKHLAHLENETAKKYDIYDTTLEVDND